MSDVYRCRIVRIATLALVASTLAIAAAMAGPALAARAGQAPLPPQQTVAAFMQWYQTRPRLMLPVSSGGAAVLVVKFTDYACPGCGTTHRLFKPILAKYESAYPGAVKMIDKDFPLDASCNSAMLRSLQGHEASCDAAAAVILSQRKKRGAPVADWFYANQELLTPATVRRTADLIAGVTAAEFNAGYAAAIQTVKADIQLGHSLGINSTPTFMINGVKVAQVLEPAKFEAALQYELKRAGKIK